MPGTNLSDALGFAGLVGVVIYIGAYGALQLGMLRGNGYAYALANLVASGLVLLSLAAAFNLSSAIIQIVWIVISLFGLARIYWLERRARISNEGQAFIARKFPTMSRAMSHSLLSAGSWHEAEAGTRLATEGERLGALIYLARGSADIAVDREVIARCGAGSFIGEISCFDGEPANATATLATPARYFRISTEALNCLCARDFELRHLMQKALSTDIGQKLNVTNMRLRATGGSAERRDLSGI